MEYIEIKAPAKINIGLNIIEKRNDGFHNLETFFYPICDLYDELTFERSDIFSFICDVKELNLLEDNLVIKAKNLLEKESSKKLNVKITLNKNIPAGAGLGGGSSDAATTLISLNEMFALKVPFERLTNLALRLGSDVPFFLKSKPAVGKSRGEILTIMDFEIPHYILIVNPGIHISTKEAFSNIIPKGNDINYESVFKNYDSFLNEIEKIHNDFEDNVFNKYPEIEKIKKIMLESGALFSLMSGSGSTVYGIFKDTDDINEVKKKLPLTYFVFESHTL